MLLFAISGFSETADSSFVQPRKSFFSRVTSPFVKLFSEVDTNYIEPNHYNFQGMFQTKYSYEVYRLSDNKGNSIRFEPQPSLKVGPYVGWSIIFLGMSVDVFHLNEKDNKKEWDFSFYTLPFGIDLYYRQSGNDYRLKNVKLEGNIDTSPINGIEFSGIESSVTGLDCYYIFNHNKFSYPAAFNQSTQQKRSCGSALAGIGFTRHSLKINWQELNGIMLDRLGFDTSELFNEQLLFEKVTYTDISISGGYGYNWVFAKNWLFASSLKLALGYKQSISDSERGFNAIESSIKHLRDFKFSNLSIDGVGRFGIVFNNGKWFAGASAIIHSYNYSKSNFYTNNRFGSFNAYAGFNFGMKKAYKKKRNR